MLEDELKSNKNLRLFNKEIWLLMKHSTELVCNHNYIYLGPMFFKVCFLLCMGAVHMLFIFLLLYNFRYFKMVTIDAILSDGVLLQLIISNLDKIHFYWLQIYRDSYLGFFRYAPFN